MTDETPSPVVSIVVPAYNAAATIVRAIRSVQAQTLGDWELIVIDDASLDDTVQIVTRELQSDPRIKLVRQQKNARQSAARNVGLRVARGRWIALLDADDAFTADRLDVLVAHAEAGKLDMLADNQLFYDASADQTSRTAMRASDRVEDWTLLKLFQKDRIGAPFKWGLLKPILRRDFVTRSDALYREQFWMGEDVLFYAELLAAGAKAAVLMKPMYVYTTARGELTGAASTASTSRYRLEDHIATYDYFREHYADKVGLRVMGAVDESYRSALAGEARNDFKMLVRRGRLLPAAKILSRYPEVSALLLGSLVKQLRYRLPFVMKRLASRRREARTTG